MISPHARTKLENGNVGSRKMKNVNQRRMAHLQCTRNWMYGIGEIVEVNDRFQAGYSYTISEEYGSAFVNGFEPKYSPREMLEMGIFEGKYINDCTDEFPPGWFEKAKLSSKPDPAVNYFGVKSRQPIGVWREKGWIIGPDPRGWFQWYCRFYLGRRIPEVDSKQIGRWRAFSRHRGQVLANCLPGDFSCRPRQRQALLQWSYDPMI